MRIFSRGRMFVPLLAVASFALPAWSQQISDGALQQMRDILAAKSSSKGAQRKISSSLVFAAMKARGGALPSVATDVLPSASQDANGYVLVDIKARSFQAAQNRVLALGGQDIYSSAHYGRLRARIPVTAVDTLAQSPAVEFVAPAAHARTNGMVASINPFVSPTLPSSAIRDLERTRLRSELSTALPLLASNGFYPALHSFVSPLRITPFVGSLTSQGYISHAANSVVQLGVDGTGVRVGVLSDSASPERVAALIATGDLPPDVVVIPGQEGQGDDEGAAMMEIVHDLAPGAKLFFATAFTSDASFADNIRTLRFTYGCDIIVDDVSWSNEPVFQDGLIASAVNDVTNDGALYFSSAANSGNLTSGTSGTWEGDFTDGGDAGPDIDALEGRSVRIHNFGTAGSPVLFDTLTSTTTLVVLHWSDPLGRSANDYDLFVLDSTGSTVLGSSVDVQSGNQDPLEAVYRQSGFPAGSRIVVIRYSGLSRAMHVDTEGATLRLATTGATIGHNAGLNTVSMAATAWNSARQGLRPFTGFANRTETFSSDGPRKIFFLPDGTPITPGNFLFATGGGQTLQKPDLTAADGVTTRTPGFSPFFGTSASAPHAAAVAALVKSTNLMLTNTQIRSAMVDTALDTMALGPDRDAGYGITMALPAVQAAMTLSTSSQE